ncbi:MAG: hypothetical protein V4725_08640 [Bacteroidota bacterium]
MLRKFYPFVPLFLFLLLSAGVIPAQKPDKSSIPPGAKFKRPNVKSYLGKVTGKLNLSAEEGRLLVAQQLRIVDDKNVPYVISSYQFAYKRIGVTEDEATGKTSPQSDIAADRFTVSPLPAVWQKNISDGLHRGEELYFFDIIVFDKQGRRFFAPEIQVTIQ